MDEWEDKVINIHCMSSLQLGVAKPTSKHFLTNQTMQPKLEKFSLGGHKTNTNLKQLHVHVLTNYTTQQHQTIVK